MARHRADARPLTPLTSAAEVVRRRAGTLGRGTAALAASSGLVLSLAAPADATVRADVPAATGALASAFGAAPAAVVTAPVTETVSYAVTSAFATAPALPAPPPPVAAEDRVELQARSVVRASRSAARPAAAVRSDVAPQVLAPPPPPPAPAPAAAPAPPPPPPPPPAVDRRAQVLEIAARYTGTMYRYGGTTPAGFDCSGYTGHVFREIGVHLPRVSHDQMLASRRIAPHEALPGDLVFMANGSGRVYHVGIYAGDGMMFDSPRSGKAVAKRPVWSSSAFFGRVL